jgi:hypothetical protein
MNKEEWEEWNKFCKVFNLKVRVNAKKGVTRQDIISTLINEGEFVFRGNNGEYTSMCLSHLKGKATKEQIKLFRDLLWGSVEKYLEKDDEKQKLSEVKE